MTVCTNSSCSSLAVKRSTRAFFHLELRLNNVVSEELADFADDETTNILKMKFGTFSWL